MRAAARPFLGSLLPASPLLFEIRQNVSNLPDHQVKIKSKKMTCVQNSNSATFGFLPITRLMELNMENSFVATILTILCTVN